MYLLNICIVLFSPEKLVTFGFWSTKFKCTEILHKTTYTRREIERKKDPLNMKIGKKLNDMEKTMPIIFLLLLFLPWNEFNKKNKVKIEVRFKSVNQWIWSNFAWISSFNSDLVSQIGCVYRATSCASVILSVGVIVICRVGNWRKEKCN